MAVSTVRVALLVAWAGALSGCGGGSEPATGGGGSGGAAAGAGGASSGTVGAAGDATAGGAAGSSGSGAGSGGTPSAAACTGLYGMASTVVLEEMGISINGVTVTADELEMYYARQPSTGETDPEIVRRSRSSTGEVFGDAAPVAELAGVCPAGDRVNPDVSDDGLTLYVSCTIAVEIGMSESVSPLRVARRADRASPFVLEAEPIGNVHAAAGVSADELTAYADGEVFGTAPTSFRRGSKTEKFGAEEAVPGIDMPLRSLDISADGLALFGAATPPGANGSRVHRAVRATRDAPFSVPMPLDISLPEQLMPQAVGAPNVTPSCALYFIAVIANFGSSMQLVVVAKPQ